MKMDNYTEIHVHTHLTNPTMMDATANHKQYIDKAKELGMTAIAFTEHGNIYQWIEKKIDCDKADIKFIHGCEFYMAYDKNIQERQTYHINLYAKNWEGVKELNRLSSQSFTGKGKKWYPGINYYYRPRISFNDVKNTSDNIIISTACLASMLWKKRNSNESIEMLEWMAKNKNRCFLEIQPHINSNDQKIYNQLLYMWSKKYGIPLIAATDTHVLDKEDMKLRSILQKAKKIDFNNDEGEMFLHFRTYEELVEEFEQQKTLSNEVFMKAIENTNKMANMCENWELDYSHKYPKISDNPQTELLKRFEKGMEKRGVYEYDEPKKTEYINRIMFEYETYVKMGMCDYILLLHDIAIFCKENNIAIAPRGSCNGALSLWALEVTDIDSIKFGLHFFRFVNPDRVSLGDVDIDMSSSKRPYVKDFLYNYPNIKGSAIITYQTLQLKGSCRIVGRGLGYSPDIVDEVAKDIEEIEIELPNGEKKKETNFRNKEKWEKKYPEWMSLLKKTIGIIENSSVHACGFVATDREIEAEIGTFIDGKTKWEISQNNMKAIDGINFVKMDFLVVDFVQIVEDTCRLAGITLNNDELDLEDDNVWNEMIKSGVGVFQFEKSGWFSLEKAIKNYNKFKTNNPGITRFNIMLALNGVIRPACESFRKDFLLGIPHKNGHEAIDNFFKDMNGYCIFQEQIMKFLEKFCHYTGTQSDNVRKGIAKKGGTDKFLPNIRKSFLNNFIEEYDTELQDSEKIIDDFIKIVDNAKNYGFSTNHSCPYTIMGYKGAYLRHYYPLYFLSVMLDINQGNKEKTATIVEFIREFTKIKVEPIKFGKSTDVYMPDVEHNKIYKGMQSIKNLSSVSSKELYELSKNKYNSFFDLLYDIKKNTSINKTKMDVLIKLDFFKGYGNQGYLQECYRIFEKLKHGEFKSIKIEKINNLGLPIELFDKYAHIPKNGVTYNKINYEAFFKELDTYIKSLKFGDPTFIQKIKYELEFLNYINLKTNKEVDRRKLFVLSLRPLYGKKNKNTPWAYSIEFYSIGSGKTNNLTIKSKIYDNKPLKEHDIIYATELHKEKGYWHCGSYRRIAV